MWNPFIQPINTYCTLSIILSTGKTAKQNTKKMEFFFMKSQSRLEKETIDQWIRKTSSIRDGNML